MCSVLDFVKYIFELETFISEYLIDSLEEVPGILWRTKYISYAVMVLAFTVFSTFWKLTSND